MKWTVIWLEEARDELAELWIQATDRPEVSAAADWIDSALKHDPEHSGTDTLDGLFLIRGPLAVAYEVIPDDCLVRVLLVVRVEHE